MQRQKKKKPVLLFLILHFQIIKQASIDSEQGHTHIKTLAHSKGIS